MIIDTYSKTLKFNSSLEHINTVDILIDEILVVHNICKEKHEANIKTALTEAVTNAVVHGNKNDLQKTITLIYKINPTELIFKIQDEGNGFNPDLIPDPTLPENLEKISGRGVFIIKHLCSDYCYSDEGKTLELTFNI